MADDIGNEPSFIETTIVPDDGYNGIIECNGTVHPCNRHGRVVHDRTSQPHRIFTALGVSNMMNTITPVNPAARQDTRLLFDRGRQANNDNHHRRRYTLHHWTSGHTKRMVVRTHGDTTEPTHLYLDIHCVDRRHRPIQHLEPWSRRFYQLIIALVYHER